MALKSTIFKAELEISDIDRSYYAHHSLTIARHPSENDERMMLRLLAFALHADEMLVFGDSIGNEDEPSLWQKDLTGSIRLWIDVGQPDEKRIRRACGRATRVFVYSSGGHSSDVWLNQIKSSIEGCRNLTIVNLAAAAPPALARLSQRSMNLQVTVQDDQAWVADGRETIHLDLAAATVVKPS